MLGKILRGLCADASQHRGVAAQKLLKGGLLVGVRIEADNVITLKLEREGVKPAAKEFETVIDFLPERHKPAEAITPTPYNTGRRYALVGKWPQAQAELVQTKEN